MHLGREGGPLKSEVTKPGHRISIPIEDIDERKEGAYKLCSLLNMVETYDYKVSRRYNGINSTTLREISIVCSF